MRRREFIGLVGGTAAWPIAARAQLGKTARVGFLSGFFQASDKGPVDCFQDGLRELGWIEGKNIEVQYRWAAGLLKRFTELADELVRLKPDVIVATSTPGAQAVQRLAGKIPVVFMGVSDPVASGIVASLARPGANVTGVSNFLPATTTKLLELLKSVSPQLSLVAVLNNPTNPGKVLEVRELERAGPTLGIAVESIEVRSSEDFDPALSRIAPSRFDAIVTLQEGVTFENRFRIVTYAEKNRLPAIYQIREFVAAGGLMSYGLNYCQHYRRGAAYVDKILRGANPAELPVELPTTFELIVNLKSAKAIGLALPETFLLRADEVIE
jgi:putative ABC transport system substrate-binding protein